MSLLILIDIKVIEMFHHMGKDAYELIMELTF